MTTRLHALCPYFAMFPAEFAHKMIEKYSNVGDLVFDPFSGRGTTVLESLLLDRRAAGMDINPVAYCVSAAKASPPKLWVLERRIHALRQLYASVPATLVDSGIDALPDYFGHAFHPTTLRQLVFLRSTLQWQTSRVDRFLAAVLLGILHGETPRSRRYLSNQMPRTISPKPRYSVKYWLGHGHVAPERDVFDRLREESEFRLSRDRPRIEGVVRLGDSRLASRRFRSLTGQVQLVVTSPPYLNLTSYEEDQWLRLWMLGHAPWPGKGRVGPDDRHANIERYIPFLAEVLHGVRPLLAANAKLVLRVGARNSDPSDVVRACDMAVVAGLESARRVGQPVATEIARRQTAAFRPNSLGYKIEVDLVYQFART